MKAFELKEMAFKSIKKEIDALETQLTEEATKGNLCLIIESPSDAAKVYLTDNGFRIKICIEPHKEIGTSTKIKIEWN